MHECSGNQARKENAKESNIARKVRNISIYIVQGDIFMSQKTNWVLCLLGSVLMGREGHGFIAAD